MTQEMVRAVTLAAIGTLILALGGCRDAADGALDDDTGGEDESPRGSVQITFEGLPDPWLGMGYALLAGPEGSEVTAVESSTVNDLPVGTYTLDAMAFSLCGTSFVPTPSTESITVTDGGTEVVTVKYAADALTPSGFRARVTGVHSVVSVSRLALLEGTIVDTERGLTVFACARSSLDVDLFPGDDEGGTHVVASSADVRWGPGDGDSVVGELAVVPHECEFGIDPESGANIRTCVAFLGGEVPLVDAEAVALEAGELVLRAEMPWVDGGVLAAAIVEDAP